MLQLQAYKIPVVYKKGKYMYLADRLSSAVFNLSAPSGPQEEMFQCDPEDPPEMFRVHLKTLELDLSDVYPNTMKETKVATKADSSCQEEISGTSSKVSKSPQNPSSPCSNSAELIRTYSYLLI